MALEFSGDRRHIRRSTHVATPATPPSPLLEARPGKHQCERCHTGSCISLELVPPVLLCLWRDLEKYEGNRNPQGCCCNDESC